MLQKIIKPIRIDVAFYFLSIRHGQTVSGHQKHGLEREIYRSVFDVFSLSLSIYIYIHIYIYIYIYIHTHVMHDSEMCGTCFGKVSGVENKFFSPKMCGCLSYVLASSLASKKRWKNLKSRCFNRNAKSV